MGFRRWRRPIVRRGQYPWTPVGPPVGPTRWFDGADDAVELTPGSAATIGGGAFSLAAAVRPTDFAEAGAVFWLGTDGTTTRRVGMEISGANGGQYIVGVDATFLTGQQNLGGQGWLLLAVTKAAGTASPRFYRYFFDTASMSRFTHGSTFSDAVNTGSVLHLGRLGDTGASSYMEGFLAVVGAWDRVLSDSEVDQLVIGLQEWYDLGPVDLWRAGDTPLNDLVGTADEAVVTGTEINYYNAPPGFDFTLVEAAPESPARMQRQNLRRHVLPALRRGQRWEAPLAVEVAAPEERPATFIRRWLRWPTLVKRGQRWEAPPEVVVAAPEERPAQFGRHRFGWPQLFRRGQRWEAPVEAAAPAAPEPPATFVRAARRLQLPARRGQFFTPTPGVLQVPPRVGARRRIPQLFRRGQRWETPFVAAPAAPEAYIPPIVGHQPYRIVVPPRSSRWTPIPETPAAPGAPQAPAWVGRHPRLPNLYRRGQRWDAPPKILPIAPGVWLPGSRRPAIRPPARALRRGRYWSPPWAEPPVAPPAEYPYDPFRGVTGRYDPFGSSLSISRDPFAVVGPGYDPFLPEVISEPYPPPQVFPDLGPPVVPSSPTAWLPGHIRGRRRRPNLVRPSRWFSPPWPATEMVPSDDIFPAGDLYPAG
jgi:hypothetical protein